MSLTVIVFATIVSPVPDSEEGRWADLREAGRGGGWGVRGPGGQQSWQTGRHLGLGAGVDTRPAQLPQEAADFS